MSGRAHRRLLPALVLAGAALALGLAARETIPDVPLVDVGGKTIDPRGAPLTEIIFVADWCQPCGAALTAARRRIGALRRDGYRVLVVGVADREKKDEFAAWARGFGFTQDLVFDESGRIEQAYGAELLPWHVVVTRDGRVAHKGDRAPQLDELRRWIGRPE